MIILDTNVISALRRPERAPEVVSWLRGQPEDALYLSAITVGEIARGIALQVPRDPGFAADLGAWLDRTLAVYGDRILPFGAREARLWGQLSAALGHPGADLQIAATALAHGAAVATRNVRDFSGTGVELVDPFAG